jgi:hypothetical protein
VTTQEDASAFVVGWNQVAMPMSGVTVTTVGAPDITQIDWFKIDVDFTAGFIPTPGFRLNWLRLIVPDPLTLTYYTSYKGKNAAGTFIRDFTLATDTLLFGDMDTALKEIIAIQAAVLINPQLLVDDVAVRRSYLGFEKAFKQRYPRKRVKNLLADPVMSMTTQEMYGGPYSSNR